MHDKHVKRGQWWIQMQVNDQKEIFRKIVQEYEKYFHIVHWSLVRVTSQNCLCQWFIQDQILYIVYL